MTEKIIRNKIGHLFPPAMKVTGYVFILIGAFVIFNNKLGGSLLVIVGIIISFGLSYIEIDLNQNRYRECSNIFGLKFGKWMPLPKYPFITLFKQKLSSTASSISNRKAITSYELVYNMYLLNQTHRKKVLINRESNKKIAEKKLLDFSKILSASIVKYNPTISTKTHARRYN